MAILLTILLYAILPICAIGFFILWIYALVLVIQKTGDTTSKVLWFLLIFLIAPAAIIYFFLHDHKLPGWLSIIFIILPIIVLMSTLVKTTVTTTSDYSIPAPPDISSIPDSFPK